ncbi:MAG: hypothetical protein OXE95_04390 [Chloroflexi bacterium]|nr:hypothetical protein [Chloroflexota bacterium]MCY4246802.1 hypothetical protein [Chloroflexota bacterium]
MPSWNVQVARQLNELHNLAISDEFIIERLRAIRKYGEMAQHRHAMNECSDPRALECWNGFVTRELPSYLETPDACEICRQHPAPGLTIDYKGATINLCEPCPAQESKSRPRW